MSTKVTRRSKVVASAGSDGAKLCASSLASTKASIGLRTHSRLTQTGGRRRSLRSGASYDQCGGGGGASLVSSLSLVVGSVSGLVSGVSGGNTQRVPVPTKATSQRAKQARRRGSHARGLAQRGTQRQPSSFRAFIPSGVKCTNLSRFRFR